MKILNKLFLLALSISLYSCEDIIEEDISDDMLTIVSPQNNQEIESNVVNFQWNNLEGADNYRLQVYSSNQMIVLDSLVGSNYFTYQLQPGNYQWRVRGENFAYQTSYTFPANFSLVQTDNLENQQVQLSYPANGLYTSNTSLTFTWSPITVAEHYVFQLVKNGIVIHEESNITNASISLSNTVINEDAQYTWRVKAVNGVSETQFASRSFYIDTTIPNQSFNIAPIQNFNGDIDEEINFEWSTPPDTGSINSPITYTIQIALDQGFTNILQTDITTVGNYQFSFPVAGTYYWRVRAVDMAGNQGNYNSFFKITID